MRSYFNNRHELIVSLKTKNVKLAKIKALELGADTKSFIERVRWMKNMKIENIDEIVSDWLSEKLRRDFDARVRKSSLKGLNYEQLPSQKQEDYTRSILETIKDDMKHLRLRGVKNIADDLLNDQLKVNDPVHKELMFKLLQANVSLFTELHQRNQGKYNFDLMKKGQNYEPLQDRLTYKNAVEKYLKYLERNIKSVEEYKRNSNFFRTEFLTVVGTDTLIADRFEDFADELDEFKMLPKGSAFKIRKGMIKDELFKDDGNTISAKTYKAYLSWCKAFFKWAFDNQYIKTNVAGSMKILNDDNTLTQRELLTDSEVRQMLSLAQEKNPDMYIILKILAYTGMRHSEFLKMTVADYGFDLTEPTLQLKTDASHRLIPRHRELMSIEDSDIFRLQRTYTDKMLTVQGMKIIREFTDNPKKVAYSLRHSVSTKLMNAGVEEAKINELLGHSKGNSMSLNRYAKGFEISILDEAINRLSYDEPLPQVRSDIS